MQVKISTDNHIHVPDNQREGIAQSLGATFDRFAHQITRLEVHLSDVNGPKGGSNDIRCLVEVRVAHREPVVASHQAASIDEAVDGAADRAFRVVETALARIHEAKGVQPSAGGPQEI
jgi:hypothetical protein